MDKCSAAKRSLGITLLLVFIMINVIVVVVVVLRQELQLVEDVDRVGKKKVFPSFPLSSKNSLPRARSVCYKCSLDSTSNPKLISKSVSSDHMAVPSDP